MNRALTLLLPLGLVLTGACGSEATDDGKADAGSTSKYSYHEHIAPLFTKHCNNCHAPDSVAPMALDDGKTARTWAAAIKQSVVQRTMPPWTATGDGSCGDFHDSGWLTDEEIAIIADWADGGAPLGDPGKAPKATKKTAAKLSGATLDLPIPEAYTPVKGEGAFPLDDYRCFLVDPKLDKRRYITAFEVVPGQRQLVHHMVAFAVKPKGIPIPSQIKRGNVTNGAVMQELEAKHSDRPGWPCYAAAGDGVNVDGVVAAWAPGTDVTVYPKGTGIALEPDQVIVMQLHYNLIAAPKPDQTVLRLLMADQVDRPAKVVLHDRFLMGKFLGSPIPPLSPGQAEAKVKWTATLAGLRYFLGGKPGDTYELFGVYPHMHKLGSKFHLGITRKGTSDEVCGIDMQRWDFNWQRMYYYKKPVLIDDDTRLNVSCTFDTRSEKQPIEPGFGTGNEMCLIGMYLVKTK